MVNIGVVMEKSLFEELTKTTAINELTEALTSAAEQVFGSRTEVPISRAVTESSRGGVKITLCYTGHGNDWLSDETKEMLKSQLAEKTTEFLRNHSQFSIPEITTWVEFCALGE